MADIIEITSPAQLRDLLANELPVLLDFTAQWCGPCQGLAPVLRDLARDWDGQLLIAQIDYDTNEDITTEFGVMGLPTLVLYADGEELLRMTGAIAKGELRRKLTPFL
ncbi:MAG: thioredoxin family protein [Bowdeniella nasicola]|nr:thioredoxin family protein [Bowdeniella nasicola]